MEKLNYCSTLTPYVLFSNFQLFNSTCIFLGGPPLSLLATLASLVPLPPLVTTPLGVTASDERETLLLATSYNTLPENTICNLPATLYSARRPLPGTITLWLLPVAGGDRVVGNWL